MDYFNLCMKKIIRLLPACFLFFALCHAQAQAPLNELRGAWIATVANIDWPSQPGLSQERQQMEFDSLMDVAKSMNLNAVFVQVRPAGDAMYKSPVIPWSRYLTGYQGAAPGDSLYDPLEYMVKSAHSRRLEFHAWFNPYRATFDLDTAALSPLHPLKALPPATRNQWFFRYGTKYYFNPANPSVMRYLVNTITDVVTRYDIDGVHFDDYFYPYKEAGQEINDYDQFATNPRGFTNIEDWRRSNVNSLVEQVSMSIKKIKPQIRFGVAPVGVWRNISRDPMGSDTKVSMTCYDDLYADVLHWLRNGWIDYVAPQLYWSIGFSVADYAKLVDWWSRNAYGKHVYIGHAAYKVDRDLADPNWYQADQINKQIALNRSNPGVQGSIFFSIKQLMRNPLGLQDSLRRSLYATQAITPSMNWLSKVPPATPQICKVKGTPSSVKLAWNVCDLLTGEEMPYYFGIYRFRGEEIGKFDDPRNLLILTPYNTENWTFEDQTAVIGETYTYMIIGYNRANVPSYASGPMYVKKTSKGLKRKRRYFGYW